MQKSPESNIDQPKLTLSFEALKAMKLGSQEMTETAKPTEDQLELILNAEELLVSEIASGSSDTARLGSKVSYSYFKMKPFLKVLLRVT